MTVPQAGQIVPSRQPEALARALAEVAARGRPDACILRRLTTHLDPQACANAYLDWFEAVLAKRRAGLAKG